MEQGQWVADLYRDHAAALLRYLTARVGSTTAEDLTAETFIVAIRRQEMYDHARGTSRAWLFGIASNALREHFRHEARYLRVLSRTEGQPPDDEGLADTVAGRVDAEAAVGRLVPHLLGLSPVDRDILLLTSWAGLGPSEIAEALELSSTAVRSRLHRTRRKVRASAPSQAAAYESESVVVTPVVRTGLEGMNHA